MGRGKDSGARPDWSALSNLAGFPRATMSRMSDATASAAALPSHLARAALHNEVHARPPEPIEAPVAISYLLMVTEPAARTASREHLAQLLKDHHLPEAGEGATHLRADLGRFRLRWERHTEFVSWTFIRPLSEADLARVGGDEPPTALALVPQPWLAGLPGEQLAGVHLWAVPREALSARPARGSLAEAPGLALARQLLREDQLTGSAVISGSSQLYTDFALHADGFSRMLVLTGESAPRGLVTPRRLGRLVQRLLEIETYRMAALLGLPLARESAAMLARGEAELAELAGRISAARTEEEPELLDRLTRLAGSVESHYAATHSRFSASRAYFALVSRRVDELAETRLEGMQTVKSFLDRRLAPAMSTCASADRRQQSLSQRISRISHLLRTRVEVEQQLGTQALLATMNARQDLQLKLQSTVEGLSVAAITYYIAGLIGYLAKGAQKLGWPLNPELSTAVAIPFIAVGVWWSLRRLHQALAGRHAS